MVFKLVGEVDSGLGTKIVKFESSSVYYFLLKLIGKKHEVNKPTDLRSTPNKLKLKKQSQNLH